jgi:hypothetical protein
MEAKRLIEAQTDSEFSIGNGAQYQYGNKYNGERYANRLCNRALVAHDRLISYKII